MPNEEALVVLPPGYGKSELLAITPYGIFQGRVLIITPGNIAKNSIAKTMEAMDENFWINSNVLFNMIGTWYKMVKASTVFSYAK